MAAVRRGMAVKVGSSRRTQMARAQYTKRRSASPAMSLHWKQPEGVWREGRWARREGRSMWERSSPHARRVMRAL